MKFDNGSVYKVNDAMKESNGETIPHQLGFKGVFILGVKLTHTETLRKGA